MVRHSDDLGVAHKIASKDEASDWFLQGDSACRGC